MSMMCVLAIIPQRLLGEEASLAQRGSSSDKKEFLCSGQGKGICFLKYQQSKGMISIN